MKTTNLKSKKVTRTFIICSSQREWGRGEGEIIVKRPNPIQNRKNWKKKKHIIIMTTPPLEHKF